jgi:hypothetical protein
MAFVDFVALKQRVSIEQTAVLLGLNTRPTGSQLRAACPNCKEGGVRAPSVRVSHREGLCGAGSPSPCTIAPALSWRTADEPWKDESPVLLFPNGFNLASAIFNAHRITKGELYLVRDPLQVLQAFESGIENVVAFLTDGIFPQQSEELPSLMDERKCDIAQLY